MSSLLEISAETEIYFRDNWIITPDIQYPDIDFDYDGLSTWIALDTAPVFLEQIGMDGTSTGREAMTALSSVFCYHTNKKLGIKLADDVKNFFTGLDLPKDIRVNYAQYNPPNKLDNGFWSVKVNFEVIQYS
jgi:hypothetical protein